jgi:hypothetical protein
MFEKEETLNYFEKLNGQQIRNILFAAASLASGNENGKMRPSDTISIAKATKNFTKDLGQTMQATRIKAETGYRERHDNW